MEKMLVAVFDDATKAYEGSRALNQLDAEGTIAIHAESVIRRNSDGTASVMQAEGDFPIRTVGGTALGGLIGLLGGPAGLALGAAGGALAGSIGDLYRAGVDADFLDEVSSTLRPGRCAVVANVSEEWVTPVDTSMEALGGEVFRAARKDIEDDQLARDMASLGGEINQLNAEHSRARADRRAKLQARIDHLNARLEAKRDEAKQRLARLRSEMEAKVEALHKKAAKTRGEAKAAIDARIARIREEYERAESKLKHLAAPREKKAG